MKHPRKLRRRGIGLFGILMMGLGIVFVISVLRGPRWRHGGFHPPVFPYAAETSVPAAPASSEVAPAETPKAPVDDELSRLHAEVMRAQEGLEDALKAGDPAAIQDARSRLASAQTSLNAKLAG